MAEYAKKKTTNLTLSDEAKVAAKRLCLKLNRPSTTNLVEHLIREEHEKQFAHKGQAVAA